MNLSNRLENAYLGILRYVILVISTISLVVVLAAAGMMLRSVLSSPPETPVSIKFEDRANGLRKGFTVDSFKKDNQPKLEKTAGGEPDETARVPADANEDSLSASVKGNVSKIADNFITYEKTVNNTDLNKERLESFLLTIPVKTGLNREKPVVTFYFETLNALSGDLVRRAPEIAKLPIENRIVSDKLLDWHARHVNKAVETVDKANMQLHTDFQKKQEAYIEKKAMIFTYASVAGGAFGLFLVIIMLSVMVRIERDLRPLEQLLADNGKSITEDERVVFRRMNIPER